jgi:effector-binding domain-containing protein
VIDTPAIVQTEAQLIALLPLKVPRAEIRAVMGPTLAELRQAIAAQGIATVGPWFTHHLKIDPRQFDFEICLAVAAPIAAAGRMKPGQWPAMKVARTVYRGPYEGLGSSWGEFDEWISAQGHKPAADLWERYLAGPESSTDPADWQTELNRPLVD